MDPPAGAASPGKGPGRTGPALKPAEVARLRRTVQEFEAIFIEHMLKTARQSPLRTGAPPSESSAEIYRSLADQELARAVSRGGGLGLGDFLLRSLLPADQKKPSSVGPDLPIR